MSQHVRGNIVDDIDPVDVRTGTILPASADVQVVTVGIPLPLIG